MTTGNVECVVQYNVSKLVDIAENTRSIVRSFRRNDVRIRKKIYAKYGRRRKDRTHQLLHKLSKTVVGHAKEKKAAIVFEDISCIRQLYLRGNGQGRSHRAKMNLWPFHELERQIAYKAAWEGIPVIQLSKQETRGTSKLCPQCGKRTQVAERNDIMHKRQLWCECCRRWQDRDILAAMNIFYKGLLRFSSSQSAASEAMVQEPVHKETVILRVDAAKLSPIQSGLDRTLPFLMA